MRFVMLGAGAIGGTLGGYLHLAGREVCFIDKNEIHVKNINDNGLMLKTAEGECQLPIPAVCRPQDVQFRPGDVAFLCVKSYDTEEAASRLREAAPQELPIFCFQNGVRNEEIASKYFPNVCGVMVLYSGTHITPGIAIHTQLKRLAMGAYPSGVNDTVRAVAAAFEGTPFDVSVTGSVMQTKWTKLLMNLNNATYGLIGLSGQEGQNLPEVRHWMADVIEEGLKVVRAKNLEFRAVEEQPSPEELIKRLRSPDFKPPAIPRDEDLLHRPSLWQDLYMMRGVVESPQFNGEIVAMGRELGIPTPLNDMLLAKSTEAAIEKMPPGQYTIEQLRSMV